jgi:hypothetical protein
MKLVCYTEMINKPERDARIKGCKFKLKALNVETNEWLTLYYKSEEDVTKERVRMLRLGKEYLKHVSEIIAL